jgi:hypothetical protein
MALQIYLGGLGVAVGASLGLAWWIARTTPVYVEVLGLIPTLVVVAIPGFVACHLVVEWTVGRKPAVATLWPFRQVRRFRGWLWGLSALRAGSAYAATFTRTASVNVWTRPEFDFPPQERAKPERGQPAAASPTPPAPRSAP